MTVNQMIESFLVYYDRITSFSAPGYQTGEIVLFLNNAQDDFIKDRMFGQNFQPPAFEDNQRRIADLKELSTITNLYYYSTDTLGCKLYTLPSDFLFAIKCIATCTRTGYPVITTGELFECNFIKTEQISKLISTVHNKTHFIKPYCTIAGTYIKIVVDRFTSNTALTFEYLKKPTALVVGGNCDLATHTHQEIVDIAVRQALQVLQDPRWQSAVTEEKLKSN
jgi:hypothetical protein